MTTDNKPDMWPQRRSLRMQGYDYSRGGAYFVTICAEDRLCLFGRIVDDQVRLSRYGETVSEAWLWLSQQYPYVELDAWVLMPNHLHGIIVLVDDLDEGQATAAPLAAKHKPLGSLVGAFKTTSTKRVNQMRKTAGKPLWQRNYYEHVVRSEEEMVRIRQYIADNPARWAHDRENPWARVSAAERRR